MKDDFELFPDSVGGDAIDPDLALITAYLAGELTLVQIAAVEERLAADTQFRTKVQPVIDAWALPVSYAPGATRLPLITDSARTISSDEVEQGWKRYRQSESRVPAGPRLLAERANTPTISRKQSMTRIAATIIAVTLPVVTFAQVASYVARHDDAPGHALAQRIVAPFVSAPTTTVAPKQTTALPAEDLKIGRLVEVPRELVGAGGAQRPESLV